MEIRIILFCFMMGWIKAEDSEIIKAMKKHEVIPDILDEGPKDLLKITFDSGALVNMGDELTPTQVQNPPTIEWNAEDGAYYTIIFTEPDAPSRQDMSMKEWQHCLIVNIPGNDMEKGDVITGYQGSAPSKVNGFNRYVYFLFKQPQKLQFDEKYSPSSSIEGRPYFSTKNFAAKYGLGTPIAGNFYRAQYDEYSPILLAKLGMM